MKRFLAGVLTGWLVLALTVVAKNNATEKLVPPQVLVENPKVKMVRWKLQPGEKTPVHTHSLDHIYVVVEGSKIREYLSDGKVNDDEQETGRAAFSVAKGKTHSFENVGTGPYEMVSIELKP
jgi:quercetin dioxygenase-like cupin family protein